MRSIHAAAVPRNEIGPRAMIRLLLVCIVCFRPAEAESQRFNDWEYRSQENSR